MKRNAVSRKAGMVEKSAPHQPVAASAQPSRPGGWLSFTYSHREITQSGGKTQVRAKEYRFENGKLEFETFAGTLDGSVYREAVKHTQQLMLAQSALLLKMFQAFLPPGPGKK